MRAGECPSGIYPSYPMTPPTPAQQQQADSDMIFTQITSGDFHTLKEAEAVVTLFYVPDMSISRAGISHALGRLKRYFATNGSSS